MPHQEVKCPTCQQILIWDEATTPVVTHVSAQQHRLTSAPQS